MMTVSVSDTHAGDPRDLTFSYFRWRHTLKLPRFAIDRWRYVMMGLLASGSGVVELSVVATVKEEA